MSKPILYLIIAVLLVVIAHLIFDLRVIWGRFQSAESTTNIQVSPATITDSGHDSASAGATETDVAPEPTLAITGTFIRFENLPVGTSGSTGLHMLIDDGTEFIPVDVTHLITDPQSSPEQQLGVSVGSTVTIEGIMEGSRFVARSVR